MKNKFIFSLIFISTLLQVNSEELLPFSKNLMIGDNITLCGELVLFNGWQPNVRFITENNEIIGIGKDESYTLLNEVNEIIKQLNINGRHSKICACLEYIGSELLPYYKNPLMCFNITNIIEKAYINEVNNTQLGDKTIQVFLPDYNSKDLLLIASVYDGKQVTCLWGLNNSFLEKQKIINKDELLKIIESNKYMEKANYFINNAYNNLWTAKLTCSTFNIKVVNTKYISNTRNDWFIEFIYKADINSVVENEKVFMLPNGAIILSSNNFEAIHFY